jgi:tRNA threonylcarbamoyladenosine biosynthesis protein TsaE
MNHNCWLADEPATLELGRHLAQALSGGGVIYLQGTLGAGKTTLARGLLRGLGHKGAVKSPTYTLVEPYQLDGRWVYHFDLYRLGDPEELEYMGIRDYFLDQNLCIIEWPNKGAGVIPQADLCISLIGAQTGRTATLTAATPRGEALLQAIASGKLPR